jgi:CRISPR/Cas system Type II protein with McrA/HNH and RuvC-like nuclease domain
MVEQEGECYWGCGMNINGQDENGRMLYELDHVVALAEGGDHMPNNTVLACKSCNSRRGAETMRKLRPASDEDIVL